MENIGTLALAWLWILVAVLVAALFNDLLFKRGRAKNGGGFIVSITTLALIVVTVMHFL